jgi:hypothetical protein
MKVVLRSSSLLFSLLGIAANAPVSKVQPLLRRGSADGIDIGTSAKQLLEEFGAKLHLDEKTGRLEAFLASPLQRRPDLSFDIKRGVVASIKVYSRRYKTETGVGVGDALLTLVNQHQIHWIDDDIAEADDLKMKFQVQDDRIISILVC